MFFLEERARGERGKSRYRTMVVVGGEEEERSQEKSGKVVRIPTP